MIAVEQISLHGKPKNVRNNCEFGEGKECVYGGRGKGGVYADYGIPAGDVIRIWHFVKYAK